MIRLSAIRKTMKVSYRIISFICRIIMKSNLKKKKTFVAAVGFEPTPPKRLVPKTSALDRSATLPTLELINLLNRLAVSSKDWTPAYLPCLFSLRIIVYNNSVNFRCVVFQMYNFKCHKSRQRICLLYVKF